MGYTTTFKGYLSIYPTLKEEHKKYLLAFSNTRRMKRNINLLNGVSDPIRERANLPIGIEGEYFVAAGGNSGQEDHESIVDYNRPPCSQPSLWCQWIPNEKGNRLIWDGGEKFYDYIEWLHYLIENFYKPWGYRLTGEIRWKGEDKADKGTITVIKNIIADETMIKINNLIGEINGSSRK